MELCNVCGDKKTNKTCDKCGDNVCATCLVTCNICQEKFCENCGDSDTHICKDCEDNEEE